MKNKKRIFHLLLAVGLGVSSGYAQESSNSSGGDASGSGGTIAYSIGQTVYTYTSGSNGNANQGVQQPYEISTTVGINETVINLEMNVYPNPTANYLTLKVEKTEGLTFQLYDLQGKVITNKKVNSATTKVAMENLPIATYFLNIVKNNQVVKTFKIIKN